MFGMKIFHSITPPLQTVSSGFKVPPLTLLTTHLHRYYKGSLITVTF